MTAEHDHLWDAHIAGKGALCVIVACGPCNNVKRLATARWIPYRGRQRLTFASTLQHADVNEALALRRIALGDDNKDLEEWARLVGATEEIAALRNTADPDSRRLTVPRVVDVTVIDEPDANGTFWRPVLWCEKCQFADMPTAVWDAADAFLNAPHLPARWVRTSPGDYWNVTLPRVQR